ncbi:hypothetical protein [Halomontanus rarus]|uniref:hypothetical protein n=1 Tax=Halomontanus rarus TaxID=3034020 RepID=UPI0023E86178|nr:hypothetical protein [Halovivax sp. TS33]
MDLQRFVDDWKQTGATMVNTNGTGTITGKYPGTWRAFSQKLEYEYQYEDDFVDDDGKSLFAARPVDQLEE